MKTIAIAPEIAWTHFMQHIKNQSNIWLQNRSGRAYRNQALRDIQASVLRFKRLQNIDF